MDDKEMRTTRRLLALGALLLTVLLVAGCSPHSEIRTGSDGLRTFTVIREINGTKILCTLFGIAPHGVEGTLEGQAGAHEPIWLQDPNGTHLSVVWPEGFTVRFAPGAELFSDKGYAVAYAGDLVELPQVSYGQATGTYDDPYIAAGIFFGDCYNFIR